VFGLKPAVPGLLGGFHIMRIGCRGLPQRDDGLPLLDTGRGVSVHVAGGAASEPACSCDPSQDDRRLPTPFRSMGCVPGAEADGTDTAKAEVFIYWWLGWEGPLMAHPGR